MVQQHIVQKKKKKEVAILNYDGKRFKATGGDLRLVVCVLFGVFFFAVFNLYSCPGLETKHATPDSSNSFTF